MEAANITVETLMVATFVNVAKDFCQMEMERLVQVNLLTISI